MSTLDLSPEIARVLDLERTLENLGGDQELLREIMDFFVELVPQQIEDLAAAVQAGEVATVGLQAHGMKGGAGNVGAVRVAATARELEMLAKDGNLAGAAELVQQLREDFRELHEVLPRLDWANLGIT
jgi:HPt (histidine-containing phosphotransfer) domain-containing protein